MANTKLEVSELDFDNIKSNLKAFLSKQNQFSDYDFEGSGMAVLLDLLAYNTHYLSFNANMLANEMYIDSADIRKNIVSLGKLLGYTPTSPKSPVAEVDIAVNDGSGASITLSRGTVFTTTVDGTSYQFVTNADLTINPVNGVYKFSSCKLYEGTLATFNYTVNTSNLDQKFIIPNADADTTTLTVTIQNSATDTTTNVYTLASNYQNLTDTSKVYFLQEGEDGKFEVYFGDGIVGKALEDGNIVKLEYVVTNRELANGASTFTLQGTIDGFSDVTITTVSNAQGGADEQSKESVRYNAPLSYTAQNRCVTTSDYETKVVQLYPNAQSVVAWGGEDDETPVYGKVKIAIYPKSGSTLTETTKDSIETSLKTFNVGSVQPQVVDADTTNILLTSAIKYNKNSTSLSSDTIKTNIITAITNYNTDTLTRFDGVFRYSKIVGLIDDTDNSIVSNITTVRMRKSFTPTLNSSTTYNVYFRNAIYNPHSGHNATAGGVIQSSGFKVSGNTDTVYFLDDDGQGNVRRYSISGGVRSYANNTQGTINYTTGAITISSLNISSIENIRGATSTTIELTTTPNSNDIVPVRGQILLIDVANSSFTVEEDTFEGGSSDAGVGYTTTNAYTSTSTSY
tara:strand:- start:2567 stop:4444 length:1878 start_codon:yes stop_codon:yes gene_type:complete